MNNEFPKMLYRLGGDVEVDGLKFSTLIVDDAEGEGAAVADKWFVTMGQAVEGAKPAQEKVDDEAPPTRDELERKAKELGISFDGRTGDKKLSALIAKKLGA